MATPGLRALRQTYPDAWIVGQLPEALVPVLEGSDVLDELWPVVPRSAGFSRLRTEAGQVARAAFDLGIVIPESISSALRMRWGRVGRVTGFARDPVRRALLSHVVAAPQAWGRRRLVSRERFVLELMRAVGVESDDVRLGLSVTKAEELRLEGALRTAGGRASDLIHDPPIVIAPGASYGDSKCWPPESYAALADRLAERGRRVVVIGGPGEHARIAAVAAAMKSRPIVLDGVLDLGGVKALIRRSRLLVANDSGTRHVAAAFGIPSVVFFGPTSVSKTADNLEAIEVLETAHDCRPCYRRTCPIDHRCLRSISVDSADEATFRILEAEKNRRSVPPVRGTCA